MKQVFATLFGVLAFSGVAQAKTPPEVIEPYKAYVAAIESGDEALAVTAAHEAWQAAETLMGETKTTGDLATNYAMLDPDKFKGKFATKEIKKAFERAIELAQLHTQDASEIELQRRVDYLNWIARKNEGPSQSYGLKALSKRVAELGFQGTSFEAESAGLKAQDYWINKKWKKAIEAGERSLSIFDSANDNVISVVRYFVPVYLAKAYEERKDPIKAALTYQKLITDLDKFNAHDNVVSGTAYGEWLRLRDEILADNSADPRIASIRDYKVPDGRTADLQPLVRQPPFFPPAFSRGSKSGTVVFAFDIDAEGYVENAKIVSSTDKRLHDAARESLKLWRYTPNIPEEDRKGLETKIRFDLASRTGRVFPQGILKAR